ncbi:MAG: ABC transporter permease [Coriobacteriales bacterium]|jgi:ABC-type dipeptide/oligopeptide/nickel transport system permease component|nr:ABC transporter permease [Coriobacteriales bacterium]
MRFALKRLLTALLTLLLVSLMTFAAFAILPGDPARVILGQEASVAQIDALRTSLGLDRPLPEQYVSWLGGFLSGDNGESIKYHQPINEMLTSYIPVTATLAALAIVLMALIAVPLALLAARFSGSWIDRVVSAFSTLSISIPGFFLAVLLIWVFGLGLRLFVAGRYVPLSDDLLGFLGYLFWPALAIAIPCAGMAAKYLRDSIVQQLQLDYIKTALGKGNTAGQVLRRHALKNSLIPALTMLGMIVGDVFAGSIIVESVFSVPGIGRLLVSSISYRDFPMVEVLVMYIACAVVAANTLVDIAIKLIDPRIRLR